MSRSAAITLASALLLLLPAAAFAHGGGYRVGPPPGEILPSYWPTLAPPGGPGWQTWSQWNRETILAPPPDDGAGRPQPDDAVVTSLVFPAVADLLGEDLPASELVRTAVAAGRLGGPERALPLRIRDRLVELIGDDGQRGEVRAAAALGLGLAREESGSARDRLLSTLYDPRAPERVRGAVALALALASDPGAGAVDGETVRALREAAGGAGEAAAVALLAMGLTEDPVFRPDLLEYLRSRRPFREGRAKGDAVEPALVALAEISAARPDLETGELLVLIRAGLASGRAGLERAAVVAAGRLGTAPAFSGSCAELLLAEVAHGGAGASGLARVSLGRIAGGAPPAVRRRVVAALVLEVEESTGDGRSLAALGLGLAAEGAAMPPAERREVGRGLLAGLRHLPPDSDDRAAYAVAAGLANARETAATLRRITEEPGTDPIVVGYCEMALARMGRLPTAARAPETRSRGGEDALLLAATARAGTRSDQFLADLCDVLEDPDQGQYRRNRRIWALGRLHDSRAVIPLVRLVRDGTEDAALRSRAARALADLAGPAAPAALARLTEDYGFGFAPAGIRGLLSLLVSP